MLRVENERRSDQCETKNRLLFDAARYTMDRDGMKSLRAEVQDAGRIGKKMSLGDEDSSNSSEDGGPNSTSGSDKHLGGFPATLLARSLMPSRHGSYSIPGSDASASCFVYHFI